MPRERSTSVAMAESIASTCCSSTAPARSGERDATVCASRRLTTSATRCCWAPSWMSRSRRRRSASRASTRRRRDTWSSSARAARSAGRCASSARSRRGAAPARPGLRDRRTGVPRPAQRLVVALLQPQHPELVRRRARRRASGGAGRRVDRLSACPLSGGQRRGQLGHVVDHQPHLGPATRPVPSASSCAIRSGQVSVGRRLSPSPQ